MEIGYIFMEIWWF